MRNPVQRGSLLLLLILATSVRSFAQETPTVEPRVEEVVRQMSDLLRTAPSFAFKAEESVDEVLESGFKVELSNIRTIALRRPNSVVSNVDGDTARRSAWFDGKTVTVLDRQHNRFAVLDAPESLDEMLDFVADEFDVTFPLADVLRSDIFESLTATAEYSAYLGIHQVEGVPTHHLAFANPWLEWQLWIDAEGDPLPRKVAITYMDEPGEPKYRARFLSWNLSPDLPDELFLFEAPEGAQKMEASRLASRSNAEQEEIR